jgi:hypothetical protein
VTSNPHLGLKTRRINYLSSAAQQRGQRTDELLTPERLSQHGHSCMGGIDEARIARLKKKWNSLPGKPRG